MRPAQLTGLGWMFIEAKRQLGTRSCQPKRGGLILQFTLEGCQISHTAQQTTHGLSEGHFCLEDQDLLGEIALHLAST